MAQLRLSEAAALCGKDPATLHRAMKKGRLSFTRSENGERKIDAAELERVFGLKDPNGEAAIAPAIARKPAQATAVLAMQLQERERERDHLLDQLADKDTTINDLRARLDRSEQERREAQARLTALIADSRPASTSTDAVPDSSRAKRRWWRIGR